MYFLKLKIKHINIININNNIFIVVMNFIAGRIGSAIGGNMFNKSVTSCDGLDKGGKPCCYNEKEARDKNMNACSKPVEATKKNKKRK
jgi:hypothetical protein